jgi:YD repeat-containing protein
MKNFNHITPKNIFIKACKNVQLILTVFCLVAITSCSKDDAGIVNKYRLIEDSELETRFEYDTQGRLAKETDLTGKVKCTYSYNTQNQVTTYVTYNYTDNTTTTESFSYKPTGQIQANVIITKSAANVELEKYRRDYYYNADVALFQVNILSWDPATSTYGSETLFRKFEYENGKLKIFNGLRTFTYDANSNIIQVDWIDKGLLNGQDKLVFDDKINPYFKLRPDVNPIDVTDKHNILNLKIKSFTGNVPFGNSDTNYIYEYNDGGYPTKKTSTEGVVNYKYEKIN